MELGVPLKWIINDEMKDTQVLLSHLRAHIDNMSLKAKVININTLKIWTRKAKNYTSF